MVKRKTGRKKKARKVGSSWTTIRKVGKRRRKVRVTKKSKGRYSVHVIGAKKRGKRRKRRR